MIMMITLPVILYLLECFLLQGLLAFLVGLPGTLALGLAQAVLPAPLIDLLAWGMVAWVAIHVLAHWAAATVLGMGWVGLVLPEVTLLVSAGCSSVVKSGECMQ
jgi:hypothetical protein